MALGHWLKNYIKWYFDPNCESGGGGGGEEPSRVLLYENDALEVSQDGSSPIIYAAPNANMVIIPWTNGLSVSIEVDGETILTEDVTSSSTTSASVGLSSPGDSTGISAGKNAGAMFTGSALNDNRYVYQVSMIMLNSNVVAKGTHSVKIYKEV